MWQDREDWEKSALSFVWEVTCFGFLESGMGGRCRILCGFAPFLLPGNLCVSEDEPEESTSGAQRAADVGLQCTAASSQSANNPSVFASKFKKILMFTEQVTYVYDTRAFKLVSQLTSPSG